MSRPGLEEQAVKIVERILENWDEASARSRAGLGRQVTRILWETSPHVGQGGP